MTNTIIKEIGIALLLLIAIALVLGILFYDYIPNNKTVPIKIQGYSMPEDVKEELEEAIPEAQNIVRTYYIDDTDLDSYEATNYYDKGKANPFEDITQNNLDLIENNNNTNLINNTEVQDEKNENEVYITTPGKNY